jgi:hypothetical protein
MSFFDIFKGPNGNLDSGRILFFIGGLNGVIAPVCFQAWAMHKGQPWDIAAFCLAYGGMLSAIISLGSFGISIKDKGVAAANATAAQNQP